MDVEAELKFLRRKVTKLEATIAYMQSEYQGKLSLIMERFFSHRANQINKKKRSLQLEEDVCLNLLSCCTKLVENAENDELRGYGATPGNLKAKRKRGNGVRHYSSGTQAKTTSPGSKLASRLSTGGPQTSGNERSQNDSSDEDDLNFRSNIMRLGADEAEEPGMDQDEYGDGMNDDNSMVTDDESETEYKYNPEEHMSQVEVREASLAGILKREKRSSAAGIGKGRRPDMAVWSHFNYNEFNKSHNICTCKGCGLRIPHPRVERLRKHIEKCPREMKQEKDTPTPTSPSSSTQNQNTQPAGSATGGVPVQLGTETAGTLPPAVNDLNASSATPESSAQSHSNSSSNSRL